MTGHGIYMATPWQCHGPSRHCHGPLWLCHGTAACHDGAITTHGGDMAVRPWHTPCNRSWQFHARRQFHCTCNGTRNNTTMARHNNVHQGRPWPLHCFYQLPCTGMTLTTMPVPTHGCATVRQWLPWDMEHFDGNDMAFFIACRGSGCYETPWRCHERP